MKKTGLSLLFLFVTVTLFAQIKFDLGIRGGVNI